MKGIREYHDKVIQENAWKMQQFQPNHAKMVPGKAIPGQRAPLQTKMAASTSGAPQVAGPPKLGLFGRAPANQMQPVSN